MPVSQNGKQTIPYRQSIEMVRDEKANLQELLHEVRGSERPGQHDMV